MLSKIPKEVWVVITTIFLTLIGGWYFFRPPPIPVIKCDSYEGAAPFTLKCTSESQYAKHIEWDFGDSKTQSESEDIVHIYRRPGEYQLTLNVYGKGSDKKVRDIKVSDPDALKHPIRLNITARTAENKVVRVKEIPLQYTKDDHPVVFSEHSKSYTYKYQAPTGYKIEDVMFKTVSAARAQVNKPVIKGNDDLAEITFRLTSGPQLDQYRGWLKGSMIVKLGQIAPANKFTVVENLVVKNYGSYQLPTSIDSGSVDTIEITESGTSVVLASGQFGELFYPSGKEYSLKIVNTDGSTFLQVGRVNN